MRFTIFGSRGFIGRNLIAFLIDRGHEVLCFEPDQHDLRDINLGHVVYSIGLTGDFRSRPYDAVEAHISLFSQLLRTLHFESCTYISSTRIYASLESHQIAHENVSIPLTPSADSLYDLSKLTGEALCLSSPNPSIRIARLSNVYGAGMSRSTFLGSIIHGLQSSEIIEVEEASASTKDYIAVSDVCKCLEYISIKGQQRIYNVASGRSTTHKEIVGRLNSIAKSEIIFKHPSKLRCFPQIDNTRILEEFAFTPQNVVDDVSQLLNAQI